MEKKYSEYTLEQKKGIVAQIKRLEELMPEYEIYLHFGTLLGSYREGALIEHDSDIDVAYVSHYHTPLEVEDEMKMLYKRFLDAGVLGLYFKQKKTKKWFRVNKEPDYDIQEPVGQCHIDFGDRLNAIDLYTTFIDENDNYYNPLEPEAWCKSDKVLPFKKGNLYDMEFNIPNDTDFILEHHYGDWRTPKDEKVIKPIYSALKLWKERYEK